MINMCRKYEMMVIVHFILMLVPAVVGYPSGPPNSTCDSMKPGHYPSASQSSSNPYTVTFPAGKTTYSENEEIEVTLAGTGGNQFKGFMIQARPDASTYTTYGNIATFPSGTANPCKPNGANKDVALAHTNRNQKDSLTFTWIAPSTNVGNIVFVFTVVKDTPTFWVKGTSAVLTYKSATTGQTTKTETTTSQTTKKVTDAAPSGQIDRDPECDVTKGCFPAASLCSSDCDYLVFWRVSGSEDVEFTLQRKTTSNNYWIAIGFSANGRMDGASVTECVSNNGAVEVKISVNSGYSNSRPDSPKDQFGVNLVNGAYTDGILSCTFTRKINISLAENSLGVQETEFFDLNEEWHLLVTHGPAVAGNKRKHQSRPQISLEKMNFLTVDTEQGTTPSSTDTGIDRDPECDVTKGCFPAASLCSSDCDYLVSWRVSGSEDVEFTLQRKTTSNNYWIAIGFSANGRMDGASVTECVSNNGAVEVKISVNSGYSNSRPGSPKDQFGVNLVNGAYTDGILSCTFTRKINISLAENSLGVQETEFFDLNEEWHLLVTHGPAVAGNKRQHQSRPQISLEKMNFLTVDTEQGTTPSSTDTGVIKKDSGCAESLGCYHDCDGSDLCGFLLTWVENGDDIDFTLTCKRPGNNVYCAIGLSKDRRMGDDSVFECVSSGQMVSVYASYNDGRNNYRLSQDKFGISNVVATYADGLLKCTFSRKKTATLAEPNTRRKKRARDPSSSTFFDMNQDFNLLYAYGSSVGGFINQHQMHPKISSEKADFQRFMDLGAKTFVHTLVKVHGVLMMVAWLFFVRLGIFVAGQYKTVWPEGMEWCGQKRWFVIHRACMVTAFSATAAAFVIIFVHVGGYSEISGSGFQKAHPIIGIVTMGLATINPIMALFRPHPGTPKRPYFNFAHITVGISAYVCAVVNVFSGFEQPSANVPFNAKIVVWVYLGWVGVIETISYIYDCKNKKASKGEAYEMKPSAVYEAETSNQRVSSFKVGILCLHAVTMLGLVIAVCVIVWEE